MSWIVQHIAHAATKADHNLKLLTFYTPHAHDELRVVHFNRASWPSPCTCDPVEREAWLDVLPPAARENLLVGKLWPSSHTDTCREAHAWRCVPQTKAAIVGARFEDHIGYLVSSSTWRRAHDVDEERAAFELWQRDCVVTAGPMWCWRGPTSYSTPRVPISLLVRSRLEEIAVWLDTKVADEPAGLRYGGQYGRQSAGVVRELQRRAVEGEPALPLTCPSPFDPRPIVPACAPSESPICRCTIDSGHTRNSWDAAVDSRTRD